MTSVAERLDESFRADPFGFLGLHETGGALVLRAFVPWADTLTAIDAASGEEIAPLDRKTADGLFEGNLGKRARFNYRLRAHAGDRIVDFEDPYKFGPVLGEIDLHLLGEGTHQRAFSKLGAHPMTVDGVDGVGFAVWAPNARAVSVVGGFNDWDGRRHPMRKHPGAGVWDLFIPSVAAGTAYKYEIQGANGAVLPLKADPLALQAEHPPATASVVAAAPAHAWRDAAWMKARAERNAREAPISIYEVQLGSWARHEDGRPLSYRELAERLVPYVANLGFTHIEVLPVSEYPFDGSWGYQPIGLFAPTSRFGTPDDFRYFVDACHQAGLALWLDWVPGHFPTDQHGLGLFDGTHLYEHADPRQGFHQDWNTLIFNYGRREVVNYLIANALSWLENFHVDGLRVDAVASMLYLDYSRKAGEWVPNKFGGRENLDAVDFLRRFNELVFAQAPGATTAAEESTAWPMVSAPTYLGGLGFGFKWNMGWMHDTLQYMSLDPIHRKYHHNKLTFGLLYAFSENFILPLSHDEVVHGKGSLLTKMPGDRWQKFANLRAYYAFMWAHPGKKLMFMGCEFGQEREWNHDGQLDWHLLDDKLHGGVHRLIRDLNQLYRSETALHRLDALPEGFAWVDATDSDQSVLSFLRFDAGHRHMALVLCNFTPQPRYGYRVGVPREGRWTERLNTDSGLYGGSDLGNAGGVEAEAMPWHGYPYSVLVTLPPLATVILTAEPS
ncbi:MAG TPA: 1,4-alpha-glucan branching protein GlgB [Aliidongia sp.]|uniref:1,4-alpha-glucan branching protein GlgB n=1 Tax=Aliidongia sp. TaxID=1914230 RepID=UPI002DDCB9F7|nr:1,4-alpha-glucan branching protein GlgB [Aliidongia sp.]HEV2675624.1 1,4-alpha-glucan branching protein GlgB [Aliidongia sp.]